MTVEPLDQTIVIPTYLGQSSNELHTWPSGYPHGYRENLNSKCAVPLKPTAFSAFSRFHAINMRIFASKLTKMSIGISSTVLDPERVNIAPHSMMGVYGKLRFSIYTSSYYPSPTRGNRWFIATPNQGHPVGKTKTWFECFTAPGRSGGTLLSQGCEYFFPLQGLTFFSVMGGNSEWGGGATGNLAHYLRDRWPSLVPRVTYRSLTQ